MGKAEREIYMTLPEEDEVQEGDTEPMVGKVLRSIYGTQDASKIFQLDYQSWLGKMGQHSVHFARLSSKWRARDYLDWFMEMTSW